LSLTLKLSKSLKRQVRSNKWREGHAIFYKEVKGQKWFEGHKQRGRCCIVYEEAF
jgi:hypothetical protein